MVPLKVSTKLAINTAHQCTNETYVRFKSTPNVKTAVCNTMQAQVYDTKKQPILELFRYMFLNSPNSVPIFVNYYKSILFLMNLCKH